MPFFPRPASPPQARPRTPGPRATPAPPRASPLLSAMALISVRPMRPPAPATISRKSDMVYHSRLRLGAVIAFDDDQVGGRVGLADLEIGLVLGRAVAGHGSRIVG